MISTGPFFVWVLVSSCWQRSHRGIGMNRLFTDEQQLIRSTTSPQMAIGGSEASALLLLSVAVAQYMGSEQVDALGYGLAWQGGGFHSVV